MVQCSGSLVQQASMDLEGTKKSNYDVSSSELLSVTQTQVNRGCSKRCEMKGVEPPPNQRIIVDTHKKYNFLENISHFKGSNFFFF
uniref:Uncharacterized protein n=1 Tax=Lepeophtheirus salmonis TaxID=72036 RepID=A0A0K2TZW0_LEPSM